MPAARCLFIISDTFIIKGWGIALVPGIKPEGDERFRVGDTVELRKPDGTVARVKISAIEMFSPPSGALPIMLKDVTERSDVPIGTEVWSIQSTSTAD